MARPFLRCSIIVLRAPKVMVAPRGRDCWGREFPNARSWHVLRFYAIPPQARVEFVLPVPQNDNGAAA